MAFKELTVQEWTDEIDRGLKFRQLYGREKNWSHVEKLFYNQHESQANEGPNIIYSTGESLMSNLSTPYPYITIAPRMPDAMMKARVTESVDNMLIDDLCMQDEIECATLAAYLWGPAILKIGYDSEFGFAEELDIGAGAGGLGITMSQYDKKSNRIEYGKGRPGMPWIAHVLPHDFVVPWGTRDIETAQWCAHRVVRHIDHVKSDAKYSNTSSLKPVMSRADHVESYNRVQNPYRVGSVDKELGSASWSSDEAEYVELWEIHDRRTNKIYVIAPGHRKFLRNEFDPLQLYGLPFVATNFVPKSRNFWTTSDADFILQAQAELTDASLQQNKKRRTDGLKFLYLEDAIDEVELENATSAEVGIGIKIKKGTVSDIRQAIAFLQPPANLNQGLLMEKEDIRRNAREMVGLSRNQFGEYESGRRSATEANLVGQNANLRLNRRQSKIAYLYTEIFRKINPIIFKYWKTPRLAQIVGEEGSQTFVQYTGDMLDADYSYKVGFSIEPPQSRQERRQTAFMAMQMAMQNPLLDPVQTAKYLAAAFNDPEFSSIFKKGVLNGGSAPQPAGGEAVQGGGQGPGVQRPQLSMGSDQGGLAAGASGGL